MHLSFVGAQIMSIFVRPHELFDCTSYMSAIIHITADTDCTLYKFSEKVATLHSGVEALVNLPKGRLKLRFVSNRFNCVYHEEVFTIPDNDYEDFIDLSLKEKEEQYEIGAKDEYGNWYDPDWKVLRKGGQTHTDMVLDSRCEYIEPYAFSDSSITSIILPDGLRFIGTGAFRSCKHLNAIEIPNSVETIKEGAFEDCSSLERVCLPNDLVEIEDSTFHATGLRSIRFPDSLQTIGNMAFSYCLELQKVYFPRGITSIGDGAFCNCQKIECINLPDHLIHLGKDAFAQCSGLKSVDLPYGLGCIPSGCFCGCESIVSISLPSSVKVIGKDAFGAAYKLKSITLPDSLKVIGEGAFCSCTSLPKITLPVGLESIGKDAFRYCRSMSSIYLPQSIKEIGKHALDFQEPFILVDKGDDYITHDVNPAFHPTYYVDRGEKERFTNLIGKGLISSFHIPVIEV